MFTEQDFENLVSRLQESYGDFITDSSSLNLLLRNCQQVSHLSKLEMGLLKGGKTYLFMWPRYGKRIIDEKGFVKVDNISSMMLYHVEGFGFISNPDEVHGVTRREVIILALEAYGDELILDLGEKFNLSIRPGIYGSAHELGELLVNETGWGIGRHSETCPLALITQEISLYSGTNLGFYSQEAHPVLHDYTEEGYYWNSWSSSNFLAFELPTHSSIPISFNFPQGFP